jgi:hypothetical protein
MENRNESLIWKEWRENLKWIALPSILILGPMILFGVPMLLEESYLLADASTLPSGEKRTARTWSIPQPTK